MNTATYRSSPTVLPESVVIEFEPQPAAITFALLTRPEFAHEARRLQGEHGTAFTAFLLGEVDLDELLEPEKLEKAFLDRHLATYADWTEARQAMLDEILPRVAKRAETDAKFAADFAADSGRFFRRFTSHLRIMRLGTQIHVFATPFPDEDEVKAK